MTTLIGRPSKEALYFPAITGVILVGGRSTRFGRNKALIPLDGVPLIERVVGVLRLLFHEVVLITNTPDEYAYLGLPMAEDLRKGLGPLGGIYTGLRRITDEAGFFVACDMPYLQDRLIHHLVAARDCFDAVVPKMGIMLEPLHALYRKSCLPAIEELIALQDYRVFRFLEKVHVKYMDEAEMRTIDPHLRSFFNINRPEDMPKE